MVVYLISSRGRGCGPAVVVGRGRSRGRVVAVARGLWPWMSRGRGCGLGRAVAVVVAVVLLRAEEFLCIFCSSGVNAPQVSAVNKQGVFGAFAEVLVHFSAEA